MSDPSLSDIERLESILTRVTLVEQILNGIRCVCLFKNKEGTDPSGFAYGSIEGRTALHNFKPLNPKDDFTFKCHR